MNTRSMIGSLCLVLAVSMAAFGRSATLVPLKDNTLIENVTGSLSNGTGDIFVGRTGQPVGQSIRRGLFEFDISAMIPSGVTITSARLTVLDVMGNNGDRTLTLHKALQEWGERVSFQAGGMGAAATNGDATWLYTSYNSASPPSSPKWNNGMSDIAGGYFSATQSASTVDLGNMSGTPHAFSWDSTLPGNGGMLNDIQAWLDDPTLNHGWVIRGVESDPMTVKRLRGRTTMSTLNSDGPQLLVTWVPEPGTFLVTMVGAVICLVSDRRRRSCASRFRYVSK